MPRKKNAKTEQVKRGRPEIVVDWQAVEKLLQIQCTGDEIAAIMQIGYSTLERKCKTDKGLNFEDYSRDKRAAGLPSLRRRQWTKAMDGDTQMLKWLGANYLGQSDRKQTDHLSSDGSMSPPDTIRIVAAPFPDDFDRD